MNTDEYRSLPASSRPAGRVELPAGPARDLRDAIYHLYARADCPRLDALAEVIADDDSLPAAPRKDLIGQIIGGDGLASQVDTVTVTTMLDAGVGLRGQGFDTSVAGRVVVADELRAGEG